MDEHTVRQLGFMLAEQARVLGMVAENERRRMLGESPAYGEDAFNAAAFTIEQCARSV